MSSVSGTVLYCEPQLTRQAYSSEECSKYIELIAGSSFSGIGLPMKYLVLGGIEITKTGASYVVDAFQNAIQTGSFEHAFIEAIQNTRISLKYFNLNASPESNVQMLKLGAVATEPYCATSP